MPSRSTSVARIQELIETQSYRIGLHAVRHMIEEGFDEYQLLQAMKGQLRVVEVYPKEKRYLVLGSFHFTAKAVSALHILCDLSNPHVVDIVTAYIPQRPWWIHPTRRGRRKR